MVDGGAPERQRPGWHGGRQHHPFPSKDTVARITPCDTRFPKAVGSPSSENGSSTRGTAAVIRSRLERYPRNVRKPTRRRVGLLEGPEPLETNAASRQPPKLSGCAYWLFVVVAASVALTSALSITKTTRRFRSAPGSSF